MPYSAADGLSTESLRAVHPSVTFDPPRVAPGAKVKVTVRFENRGEHTIVLPFRRPCDGQVALREFEPNRNPNAFGLGEHLLLREDPVVYCRQRKYEIESVWVYVPPGGSALFTGQAKASYDADAWPRDDRGFPKGPEPKPHKLKKGSYTFVTDPGFCVPINPSALPGGRASPDLSRMAWYPELDGHLDVK